MTEPVLDLTGLDAHDAYWLGAYVAFRRSRSIAADFDFAKETRRAIMNARVAHMEIATWCRDQMNAHAD